MVCKKLGVAISCMRICIHDERSLPKQGSHVYAPDETEAVAWQSRLWFMPMPKIRREEFRESARVIQVIYKPCDGCVLPVLHIRSMKLGNSR